MKLLFVVAVSEDGIIGVDNELPWYLPDDLKFFKRTTLGKPVIMGRNTFVSLGKPLPGRMNIVLSKSLEEAPNGTKLFSTLEEALAFLKKEQVPEACIIGGGMVFEASRKLVDTIFLTRVHTRISGGTAFFALPDTDEWRLVWSENHQKDEKHAYAFTFEKWERITG